MIRIMALALLVLGVVGCAGSVDPTRFYVLAPVAGAADAPRAAAMQQHELRIGVRSVDLPRYLERPQIVTRTSANRLELAELHQWGAPLRYTVPAMLAENLARLVPTDQIAIFPWGRSFAPDAQVVVEISRLEGTLGGDSVLTARWRITGRSGEEIAIGASRFTEASGVDYETLVAAHSRLITALSRDIADGVRQGVQVTAR
jgi:uncharacterized lipoprotein YmbA